jgi:hypothetical protein
MEYEFLQVLIMGFGDRIEICKQVNNYKYFYGRHR